MIRRNVTLLVALGVAGLLALDHAHSQPLNPYTAPPMLALGSGLAATGGHCAAPPPPVQ
ncbi:hypothetical protein RA2_00593 [Roseovarius sp. A-2]|uniref:hypothetical protein n=1 Tax=Roseovarius sp. A-2 TaxID=1570360 RepID=UPI0009CAC4FC|nr:hypothetical protein [Roseovarius sp. A-2]GAW33553.1 hypothetical protein RA2_00593 [Roseovarius sp. A-2]